MTTDMREKIEAMLAGLEGVTPGPYVISQDTHKWIDTIGLAAENCWSDNRDADAAHFSRCDPDTIRELCRLAKIGMESELRGRDAAALREAYRAAMERAARLAESHFAMSDTALDLALESDAMDEIEAMHAGNTIAAAIRALKEKQV